MIDISELQRHFETLLQNEVFTGTAMTGVLMSMLVATWAYIKQVPNLIARMFVRYCTIQISLEKSQGQFFPVVKKLHEKHKNSGFGQFLSFDVADETRIPGGVRWHRQGLTWFKVILSSRNLDHADSNDAVTFSLDIQLLGFRKRKQLDRFLAEAEADYKNLEDKWVYVWRGGYWDSMRHVDKRDINSIISEHTQDIVEDLEEFQKSKDWYIKNSIPYRRGLLLFGPPGTGKSSMASALAYHLGMDLKVLPLSGITAKSLSAAFSCDDTLILIEDIDVATNAALDRDGEDNANIGIKLSDLLNALDGVASGSGNIILITTNRKESLDPALIRPGRVDRMFEMGYLNQETFDRLCTHYYGETCGYKVGEGLTAATVQGIFIRNRHCIKSFETELKGVL